MLASLANPPSCYLAGTASKVIMTKEFEEDMEMQGMSGPEDLFMLELAMLLGRAVVSSHSTRWLPILCACEFAGDYCSP